MRSLIKNKVIAALLALALLLKVMVPDGFMPDMNALQHGVYKITICSGYAHKEIMVDDNQKQVDGKVQKENGHKTSKTITTLCPFAGLHSSGMLVALMALALVLFWRELLLRPQGNLLRSVALSSAWPRGPPALI